jgi:hypothetical protein
MKLLVFVLILFLPYHLFAQGKIELGQSKDKIRNFLILNTDKKIKVSNGNNCDTVTVNNGLIQTLIYYKNDMCNSMKVTMHYITINAIKKQLTDNSFTMLKEGVWLNQQGHVRADVTADKSQDIVIMVETQIDKK